MKVVSPSVLVYQFDMNELVRDQWYWRDLYRVLHHMRLWGGVSGVRDALDAVLEGHEGAAE